MLRKGLALALFALCAAPMFASVGLDTSINDVFNRGTNELAGSINWTVTDDDFRDASTDTPVFIRVTPDHNSFLAETLVFQPGGDPVINQPINLAMTLDGGLGAVSMVALPEAVSIVRWVAGESSLWIRVQQSSDEWLAVDGGGLQGPSDTLEVSWEIGISARRSDQNSDADTVFSNLPFNTRDAGASEGDFEDASSTLICVNLSASNLLADGTDESLLKFDIIAFDENAEIGLGSYSGSAGNDTGINFTNDFSIARGKDRACTLSVDPPPKSLREDAFLCISRAGTNESANEFVKVSNVLTFVVSCSFGGNFLDSNFVNGAYIRYTTNGREEYGFDELNNVWFTTENNGASLLGSSYVAAGSGFNNNGRTLYTTAILEYIGADQISLITPLRVSSRVCLYTHYTDGETDASVDWQLTLVSHDGAEDDAPYDGSDQHRRCEPSEFAVGDYQNFVVGSFLECQGNPVSIFFPYVPRLVGNSDFWVGLSYVNQGSVDFQDDRIYTIFYDENGDRYAASMPGLGQKQQQTWLIIANGETGIGEIQGAPGSSVDGEVRIPTPDDPNAGPEAFGSTRMSMYVRGTFDAEFLDDIYNGDLDGYLLVGSISSGSIDGAYLPRNYDNDIPGQNADLPLRRSKGVVAKNVRVTNTIDIDGDRDVTPRHLR